MRGYRTLIAGVVGIVAITMRVYGVRVLHGSRGTAPPYARNIWPPVQP